MIVLALWVGAAVYFAAIVAPAAFRVLPSRTMAGMLVANTLPTVFTAGIVTGVIVCLLGLPGASRVVAIGTGAGVALCSAIARLGIVPRIDRLRAALPSALESLPAGDPARVAFGRLHAVSVGLLGIALILAVIALVVAVRGLSIGATIGATIHD